MMQEPQKQLLALAASLAKHQGVTHYAISQRLLGRGDFFAKLQQPNRDIRYGTYKRVLISFSKCWPTDLEWPADIPRPSAEEQAE